MKIHTTDDALPTDDALYAWLRLLAVVCMIVGVALALRA